MFSFELQITREETTRPEERESNQQLRASEPAQDMPVLGIACDVPYGSIPIDYSVSLARIKIRVVKWCLVYEYTQNSKSDSLEKLQKLLDTIFLGS